MDVDKKPCEDSSASTQSNIVNRTSEEEPERIVKVTVNIMTILISFYLTTNWSHFITSLGL